MVVLAGVQVACCAVARLADNVMEPPLLAAYLRAPLASSSRETLPSIHMESAGLRHTGHPPSRSTVAHPSQAIEPVWPPTGAFWDWEREGVLGS